MYLCGPGKHNCQPFCGPEGRFYCSDSVCSLWPAPFSYLCVSVMILGHTHDKGLVYPTVAYALSGVVVSEASRFVALRRKPCRIGIADRDKLMV